MWQECRIYDLEHHKFIDDDKVEAAREAAYQEQYKKVEQTRN